MDSWKKIFFPILQADCSLEWLFILLYRSFFNVEKYYLLIIILIPEQSEPRIASFIN